MQIMVRKSDNENFARFIRLARHRRGLSQEELAKKVGVLRMSISGYENAYYRPKPNVLKKLEIILGTLEK